MIYIYFAINEQNLQNKLWIMTKIKSNKFKPPCDGPIIWKSHLQWEVTLSTPETEYLALTSTMRTLLPLRAMLVEIIGGVNLLHIFEATVKCQVFEDNNRALLVASNKGITNLTKCFQVKRHFFWAHGRDGRVVIIWGGKFELVQYLCIFASNIYQNKSSYNHIK